MQGIKFKMYERHELGKDGEEQATDYLKNKGYEIIERNYECRQGEIDIIAKDKEEYVFIEVKTRQNLHYGMPAEAVTPVKEKHIWNASKYYIYSHKLENKFIRFDVIEVYKRKNQFYINHIKQVMW